MDTGAIVAVSTSLVGLVGALGGLVLQLFRADPESQKQLRDDLTETRGEVRELRDELRESRKDAREERDAREQSDRARIRVEDELQNAHAMIARLRMLATASGAMTEHELEHGEAP